MKITILTYGNPLDMLPYISLPPAWLTAAMM
jgi:hypothetical protein